VSPLLLHKLLIQPIEFTVVGLKDEKQFILTGRMDEKQIRNWIQEALEGTDRFLVELIIKPGNRIMIFIDSDTSVFIDHCISLSRFIESRLNRDEADFELNVSSAGLDQPYKLLRQYIKNTGREVAVIRNDGSKITGTLIAADLEGFNVLERTKIKKIVTEENHRFSYSDIKETKEIINFNSKQ